MVSNVLSRLLSRVELIDLLSRKSQEYHVSSSAFAKYTEVCELSTTWRNGNTVLLGAGQGQRSVMGIRFVISREWSSRCLHYLVPRQNRTVVDYYCTEYKK